MWGRRYRRKFILSLFRVKLCTRSIIIIGVCTWFDNIQIVYTDFESVRRCFRFWQIHRVIWSDANRFLGTQANLPIIYLKRETNCVCYLLIKQFGESRRSVYSILMHFFKKFNYFFLVVSLSRILLLAFILLCAFARISTAKTNRKSNRGTIFRTKQLNTKHFNHLI